VLTLSYSANGNLTSGHGRSLRWTSYDQPADITQNSATVSFVYDADHQRIKQISPDGTTWYVNPAHGAGLFYEKVVSGFTTQHLNYLSVAGQVVAVVEGAGLFATTWYWHLDHLGSLATITDSTGAVVQRCSYDAFGQRSCDNGAPRFSRGFTGHEHLDAVGLIHMNGRVYDPQLGRFLSADPFVPDPDDAQSYNRYSYVQNQPFKYSDPSGFLPFNDNVRDSVLDAMYISPVGWQQLWQSELTGYAMSLANPVTYSLLDALPDVLLYQQENEFWLDHLCCSAQAAGNFCSSAIVSQTM